ncbi:MAG: hypothetical protein ABJB74_19765 [Gemmatimonas sp.]
MKYLIVLCVIVSAGRPSAQAWSQGKRPLDAAVVDRFAHRLSRYGGPGRVLRAPESQLSTSERRAIADTLVAIAITADRHDPNSMHAPEIIAAFLNTSRSTVQADRTLAVEKLRELADNPSNQVVSSVAVMAFTQIDDKATSLKHVREIAISHSLGAFTAVAALGMDFGEEGRMALKQITLQNLVVQPQAMKDAEGYARLYKWREK